MNTYDYHLGRGLRDALVTSNVDAPSCYDAALAIFAGSGDWDISWSHSQGDSEVYRADSAEHGRWYATITRRTNERKQEVLEQALADGWVDGLELPHLAELDISEITALVRDRQIDACQAADEKLRQNAY